MFPHRQVLARLREGDSERVIARAGLMGREKVAAFRALAQAQGWLAPEAPMPEESTVAAVVGQARRARSSVSSVTPWRTLVSGWLDQGVQGKAIHAALARDYGYSGSYSSVHRLIVAIRKSRPPQTTIRLHVAPAEAAQVDFGAGPLMSDAGGASRRTWAFVMTLCFSRHQYVEFVWDQTAAIWLGCHRRAFEWFGAVPARLIIDNAKCAITKACRTDPVVQRAYAECALGYGFKIEACPPADPQKKGIVESGVKYVKNNFLALRTFRDLWHAAVRQGVDVAFFTCAGLTASLSAARAIGAYERKLASLARVPLLIIDDFGLKPLRPPADEDLHDLIAERYESTATIVTSNLDFTEWDQAFPANRLLASATLDRLRHNAYCLTLDGDSFRTPRQLPSLIKTSPVAKPAKNNHS